MNYDVFWDPAAIEALERIAVVTSDREGLAHTVLRIGKELRAQPLTAGESRDQGQRVLFKHPLVVHFRVNERMKTVTIFAVGPLRR